MDIHKCIMSMILITKIENILGPSLPTYNKEKTLSIAESYSSKDVQTSGKAIMNASTNIDVNSVINGKFRSMTLGQILDSFMSLLISNDPRKDQFEEIKTEKEIIPRFVKTEWYSTQIFKIVQTFPCTHLTIHKDGQKIFESDNIELWFIALSYYGAFIEDTTSTGFCWYCPANPDELYEADFSQ